MLSCAPTTLASHTARSSVFGTLAGVILIVLCSSSDRSYAATQVQRPHLIVVVTNAFCESSGQSADADRVVTPGLDRLAKLGLRFDNYVANTSSPAANSRTLMTGHYAFRFDQKSTQQPTVSANDQLGQLLADKGYACEVIDAFRPLNDAAFDIRWPAFASIQWNAQTTENDQPLKKRLAAPALTVIQRLQHHESAGRPGAILLRCSLAVPSRSAADRSETCYADQQVSGLLDAYEHRDLPENTILIFTSLSGTRSESASPQRDDRTFSDLNRSLQSPLLMYWPGKIPAGRRSNACISTVDLLPTLCGMLGVGYPDEVDGIDLSDSTRVDCSCEPDFAFLHSVRNTEPAADTDDWRAVRDQRFTYVRAFAPVREFLFDNHSNPGQSNNPAQSDDHDSDLRRLRQWLAEKRLVLNDRLPD